MLEIVSCPQCRSLMAYDDFEDIWNCMHCGWFAYPLELGLPENSDAGYLKLAGGA